jgi:hypothetical protein
MNRHKRRKAHKTRKIALNQIDSQFDIQVDGKVGQVLMIFANATGRKVVEELWPDVEWTTDERFSRWHSPDWLFTHVRVTKLQPHLEGAVPLAFASSESLGYAVALALQSGAEPGRVAFWTGQDRDVKVNAFGAVSRDATAARSLFVEHVPAGSYVGPHAMHDTIN